VSPYIHLRTLPILAEAAYQQGKVCQKKKIGAQKSYKHTQKSYKHAQKSHKHAQKSCDIHLIEFLCVKRKRYALKRVINTLKRVINTLKRAVIYTSMSSYVNLRSFSLLAEAAYQQGKLCQKRPKFTQKSRDIHLNEFLCKPQVIVSFRRDCLSTRLSCSVLQCVAVCCSVLQSVAVCCSVLQCATVCCSVLQCVAVCCSVLQCVAVCRSVSQCVAVCCSVLR